MRSAALPRGVPASGGRSEQAHLPIFTHGVENAGRGLPGRAERDRTN